MTQHTDYLDNPIAAGDVVIYPTASGSSSAQMNAAIVSEVDPIVEGYAWRYGSQRLVTTLKSYLDKGKKDPTEYRIPKKRVYPVDGSRGYQYTEDPSKAYVLRIYKLDASWNGDPSGKAVILSNVDRVTVVPPSMWGPEFREKIERAQAKLREIGVNV